MDIYLTSENANANNSDFIPTYLYIKQHNITGLKYFGKTTKKDPIKYKGSGKYWKRHLKIHGSDITTLWYELFIDEKSLTEFAINFSEENNIAESEEWANLILENGLDGGIGPSKFQKTGENHYLYGKHRTPETKAKISAWRLDNPLVCGENNPSAKIICLKSPDGIEYEVNGSLEKFCKEHKISYCTISLKLTSGRISKGSTENWLIWYKEEGVPRSQTMGFKLEKVCKIYEFTYFDSSPFIVTNMKQFCRENNLHSGHMYRVANGKVNQYKGYKCKEIIH